MSSLTSHIKEHRKKEIEKYGRNQIYSELRYFLPEKRKKVLDFVNHGIAIIDDFLDSEEISQEYLEDIKKLFQESFSSSNVKASKDEEKIIVGLGKSLYQLFCSNFINYSDRIIAKHTYEEVLSFWDVEQKNIQRKWKILDKKELNEINTGIGALVASQFIFILDPPTNPYTFIELAKAYGNAVKSADNLCDFREDTKKGFINIPKEDISHLKGLNIKDDKVLSVDNASLNLSKDYIEKEYNSIKQKFESANNLLLKTRLRNPVWKKKVDKGLKYFGYFCNTWLEQAKEFSNY